MQFPDFANPDVTCPDDITLPVSPGTTSREVTFPNATATDNSGQTSLVSVVPPSGSTFPIGTTDVRFVFVDPSGNEGSCTFSVTITTTRKSLHWIIINFTQQNPCSKITRSRLSRGRCIRQLCHRFFDSTPSVVTYPDNVFELFTFHSSLLLFSIK